MKGNAVMIPGEVVMALLRSVRMRACGALL